MKRILIFLIATLVVAMVLPPKQAFAATIIAECPPTLALRNAAGFPDYSLYIGGEDDVLNECILALYTGNFSLGGPEFVKRDAAGTTNDYNHFDTSGMQGDRDCYNVVAGEWALFVNNTCGGNTARFSVFEDVDIQDGTVYESNLPLFSQFITVDYHGPTGTFSGNALILAGTPILNATLSTSGATFDTRESIPFTLTYSGATGTASGVFVNLLFYPFGRAGANCNTGCPENVLILDAAEVSSGGTITFYYDYQFAGTKTPIAIISDNCSEVLIDSNYNDCNLSRTEDFQITIEGEVDFDVELDYTLEFPPTGDNRIIDTNQSFNYVIDSEVCPTSTISESRIFKGYPVSIASQDSGTVLSPTESGSTSIQFEFASTDFTTFYPYIDVLCSDSSVFRIYNGSTTFRSRAKGIVIVTPEHNAFYQRDWLNGGTGFGFDPENDEGHYFFTDKQTYQKEEEVLLRFYYSTPFAPSEIEEIEIFRDNESGSVLILTGAFLVENVEYNTFITYEESGTFYPRIVIKKTGYDPESNGTFVELFLGGNEFRDPTQYVQITETLFGATGFMTDSGIFGLDPSTFSVSFGSSQNPFLLFANAVVNITIRAALYIASLIFSLIEKAPFFGFMSEIISPPEGAQYTIPSSVFGIDLPDEIPNKSFTIAYADTDASDDMLSIIKLLLSLSIVWLFIKQFF